MDVALAELQRAFDERGLLVPGALAPPGRHEGYVVFAQQADARVDGAALERQAAQFFRARLGLLVPKRYGGLSAYPREDAVAFLIGPEGARAEPVLAFARPRSDEDVALADAAELARGGGGLAGLARRCPQVWHVRGADAAPRNELLLAAVLASVVLGPIVEGSGPTIFGVRSARERLEGLGDPYR